MARGPFVVSRYVVVVRATGVPIQRFMTPYGAADYIVKERRYADWQVLAQDGAPITAGTPYRTLTKPERREVEKALYPTLFD